MKNDELEYLISYYPEHPEVAARVKNAKNQFEKNLFSEEVKELNIPVLTKLLEALHFGKVSTKEVLRVYDRLKIMNVADIGVIGENTFIAPYILALGLEPCEVKSKTKETSFFTKFISTSEKYCNYTYFNGAMRTAIVPEVIEVMFVNRGKNNYSPITKRKEQIRFRVSLNDALILSGYPLQRLQPSRASSPRKCQQQCTLFA